MRDICWHQYPSYLNPQTTAPVGQAALDQAHAFFALWPLDQPVPPPTACAPGYHLDPTGERCEPDPIDVAEGACLAAALSLYAAVKQLPALALLGEQLLAAIAARSVLAFVAIVTSPKNELLVLSAGASALAAWVTLKTCVVSLVPPKKRRPPPPLDPPIAEMPHVALAQIPTPMRLPIPQFALAPVACDCATDFEEVL
jgi:hypothetical protein